MSCRRGGRKPYVRRLTTVIGEVAATRSLAIEAAQRLRALYDGSLGPYLQARDAEVLGSKRNRGLVLFGGLALAGGIMHLVVRSGSQGETVPAIAFGIAVASIGLFAIMKGTLADMLRDHVMAAMAFATTGKTNVD